MTTNEQKQLIKSAFPNEKRKNCEFLDVLCPTSLYDGCQTRNNADKLRELDSKRSKSLLSDDQIDEYTQLERIVENQAGQFCPLETRIGTSLE